MAVLLIELPVGEGPWETVNQALHRTCGKVGVVGGLDPRLPEGAWT